MRTLLVSGLLALFAASPPAAAQLTEKEAIKQLKTASKAQVAAFKQAAAAALSQLDASLDLIDGLIGEASDSTELGAEVASAAILYMTELNGARGAAKELVESAASQTLVALADGGDLAGIYPDGFSYGTGGTLDKHKAQLVKAGVKSRDAALKRLGKTAALAEKKAAIGLGCDLLFPSRSEVQAVNQSGLLGLSQTPTLDVIVAASDMGVANDGLLLFAGETSDTIEDITAGYYRDLGESDTATISPDGAGRFLATFQSVPEGGYVVWAMQAPEGSFETLGEIGLR